MSLYNLVFANDPLARGILWELKIAPREIDRLRDASLVKHPEDGRYLFRVLTRTGGSNQENHVESNSRLEAHSSFLGAVDDSYDPTYRQFFFKPSAAFLKALEADAKECGRTLDSICDFWSLQEKWEKASEGISRTALEGHVKKHG